MVTDKNHTRRKLLKASAAGLTLNSVSVGSAYAGRKKTEQLDNKGNNNSKKCVVADESNFNQEIELTTSNSKPKREWEQLMNERKERLLDQSEAFPVGLSSDPHENIEYADHWTQDHEYDANFWGPCCPTGTTSTVVEAEHVCTLFEAMDDNGPITDSNGNYYYLIELWVQAEGKGTPWDFSPGRTEKIEHMLEVHESYDSIIFEARDPATTKSVNGEWVTIKKSLTVGGVSYGSEDAVYIEKGTFGPDTWRPGGNGEYELEWEHGGSKGEHAKVDMMGYVLYKSEYRISDMSHAGLRWVTDLDHNFS